MLNLLDNKRELTVADVGHMMGLSRRSVMRLFEREKGILIFNRSDRMQKRRRSIRIPWDVYTRVLNRVLTK